MLTASALRRWHKGQGVAGTHAQAVSQRDGMQGMAAQGCTSHVPKEVAVGTVQPGLR